ncbi:hypothetical protein QBC32DRAFT_356783, partial [Pseudoneurospora amorphoporcata]
SDCRSSHNIQPTSEVGSSPPSRPLPHDSLQDSSHIQDRHLDNVFQDRLESEADLYQPDPPDESHITTATEPRG